MSEISVASIGATNTATTSAAAGSRSTLDSDGFLKLLIAQLQNQDPSSPMDTTAMMEQTTQLSMMEQLTSMATVSKDAFALQQRMAAAQLVGQTVTWTDTSANTYSGVVSAVSYAGSEPTVTVGSVDVALTAITSVTPATA